MSRRGDRWWMRWYVVRAVRGSTAGGYATDDDEWVECATLTRAGARHMCRWAERRHDLGLRPVRRTEWLSEHVA